MLKADNIVRICGLVSLMLLSAGLISYTSKSIFKIHKAKALSVANLIYDPELNLKMSHICMFSKDVYRIAYNSTPCFNKTLLQWYNPWVRYHLWKEFQNELDVRLRIKQLKMIETNISLVNQTTEIKEEEEQTVAPSENLEKENIKLTEKVNGKSSEIIYSILVGFLVASAMVALWEVCKDKIKKDQMKTSKTQDKSCTLADFTINRHLRRESKQQNYGSPVQGQAPFEMTEKVTRTLVHQSSLDRTFPKPNFGVKSLELRRNSVPLQLMSSSPLGDKIAVKNVGGSSLNSSNSPLRMNKRESVHITGKEFSLEQKKKSKFFIRRH